MTVCDLCLEEIKGAPFTIVLSNRRPIENVCGACMNLYGNQMFDELMERIAQCRGWTEKEESG